LATKRASGSTSSSSTTSGAPAAANAHASSDFLAPPELAWLKRSLEAVKEAHLKETPQHLALKVQFENENSTADGLYPRIIVHANEHMGQLIAYARMSGIVPPWSAK
jgi:uncharacterized damage-inducible protein DinB